jgi:ABC-type Fe3+-hydroxamate transport system substrate-binding protein
VITLIDQTGQKLIFDREIHRIVSLVPSLTETLADIGMTNRISGITKFCVHPSGLKKLVKVIGGTKNPRIKEILSLNPDLVIANKEENRLEDIQQLKLHTQVYVTDIRNFSDVIDFINDMSVIISTNYAHKLVENIQKINTPDTQTIISVCYLIWKEPFMSVGHDTFIHFMLERYRFRNILSHQSRYPETNIEEIKRLQPQVILLSSEPYPFKETHQRELQALIPNSRVILVDGEMFSWYGSRIILADDYIKKLHHMLESPSRVDS